jgi:hypothetical protein
MWSGYIGRALNRLFELRNEVAEFLTTIPEKSRNAKKSPGEFSILMCHKSSTFLTKLAYLCDIFQRLNELNLSLQGKKTEISRKLTF